jgi:hypothetical protein
VINRNASQVIPEQALTKQQIPSKLKDKDAEQNKSECESLEKASAEQQVSKSTDKDAKQITSAYESTSKQPISADIITIADSPIKPVANDQRKRNPDNYSLVDAPSVKKSKLEPDTTNINTPTDNLSDDSGEESGMLNIQYFQLYTFIIRSK